MHSTHDTIPCPPLFTVADEVFGEGDCEVLLVALVVQRVPVIDVTGYEVTQ